MEYTVRFAHMEDLPNFKEGDIIHRNMLIGKMGSSGQSKKPHLHIDVIEGFVPKLIRLQRIGYEPEKAYVPNIRQLNYLTDKGLFKFDLIITTYFYDPEYTILFKKDPPAYDVVPKDSHRSKKHFDIFWNRSKKGTVLKVGYDEKGYGNYILIDYEA